MEREETIITEIEDYKNEEVLYRYSITSYGVDYVVDTICKRIKDDIIFVPPFQRKFVWNISQASKFIESLIIGLPVPGIFLSKEEGKSNRMLIIDGQQRLLSLFSFYEGKFKDKIFRLTGVHSELDGKSYKELSVEDKRRLDDAVIHATIIKQDEPSDDESSVYLIFERLNQGGKPLNPQEIRSCIFYGKFNELLGELVRNKNWRKIFGKYNERLKEEELILRFFSLYYELKRYEKPLKNFMNKFMKQNRDLSLLSKETLKKEFEETIKVIFISLNKRSFRIKGSINAAVFDSLMIATANRLKKGPINDPIGFLKKYEELTKDSQYLEYTQYSTSDEKPIRERIKIAIEYFESVT